MYLAACGETLNIDFTLPFNEFVPTTCHTRFSLKVSRAVICPIFVSILQLKQYFPPVWDIRMFPLLRWIFFYLHIGLTSWTPNISFHGCLRARECFLLVRQRTQICDCPCQSATQVAALSSLWPKTIRTSNFPQIWLSQGRTKVLQQPKQQSPAGETSPMQSECVNNERHCCNIGSYTGDTQEMSSCLPLPCLLSNLRLLCAE